MNLAASKSGPSIHILDGQDHGKLAANIQGWGFIFKCGEGCSILLVSTAHAIWLNIKSP